MKHTRILALLLAAVLLIGALPAFRGAARAETTKQYWAGVDVQNQRVTIYRTSDNSVVHRWICSTGKASTPTPQGIFYMPAGRNSDRREWYNFDSAYVKYAARIVNGIYFHSILFKRRSDSSLDVASLDLLGQPVSHGCIRLEVAHAKWISENLPFGTKVIIHKGVNDPRIVAALGAEAEVEATPSLPMPPALTALKLDHTGTVTLNKGEKLQLNCTCEPEGASSFLRWKSSKTKYATVNSNGLVTAKASGTAVITVTASNGKTASVRIQSVDPTIARSISLDRTGTVILNKGETLQLNATVVPDTAATALKWKSSKPRYAVVSSKGLVTARAQGTTRITVKTANKKKATVYVKVVDPTLPTRVLFAQHGPVLLHVGESTVLTPKLLPDTAVTAFTWRSSKKKVAKVDRNGKVTAYRTGTAKITVKTANKKKATIVIKVVK